MALIIESRDRVSADDEWGEWAVTTDTADMTGTDTIEYRVQPAVADIEWEDIVGDGMTVADGGYMGDLLTVARAHVDDAVATNRLAQAQAGEVYTAMIPAAMNSSIQFALEEFMKEAQVADVVAGTAIKEADLAIRRNASRAELEKQWGYNVSTDVDTGEVILGASTGTGKIDVDIINSKKQGNKLDDELLTTAVQRALINVQKDGESYKVNTLLPDEHTTNTKQHSKLDVDIANVTKQGTLLDTEEEAKQYEVDNMLPKQLAKLDKDIDVTERSTVVQESKLDDELLTSTKQRVLLDDDHSLKSQQELSEKIKNGGLSYVYTYYEDTDDEVVDGTAEVGNIRTKVIATGDAKSIYEIQADIETYKLETLLPDEHKINGHKDTEIVAATTRSNTLSAIDAAIKEQQEVELSEKNGGYAVTYTYYTNGVDGETATTTDLAAIIGPILGTATDKTGSGVSVLTLTKKGMQDSNLVAAYKLSTLLPDEHTMNEHKDTEIVATTARNNTLSALDAAIKTQQEVEMQDKNGGYAVTYTYYVNGADGATASTNVLVDVVGPVLSTTIDASGTSESVTALTKEGMRESNAKAVIDTNFAYTSHVAKDKEAVALGMDDALTVVKRVKDASTEAAPYIYKPYYTKVEA